MAQTPLPAPSTHYHHITPIHTPPQHGTKRVIKWALYTVSSLLLASHRLCRGGVQGRRRGGGGGSILVLRLLRRDEVLLRLLLRLLRRRVGSARRLCVLCVLGVHVDGWGLRIASHVGRNLTGSFDWPTGVAVLR